MTELQTNAYDEWARPFEGRIRSIGRRADPGQGSDVSLYREYSPSGDLLFEHSFVASAALTECAWGAGKFACAEWGDFALGNAASSDVPKAASVIDPDTTATRVHWDGEAFVVHLASPGGVLERVRVDASGDVVQARVAIGSGYSGAFSPSRPRLTVEPKSGRTFVVVGGAGAPTLSVSGFERDGTPLFPANTLVQNPTGWSQYPGVANYGGGVLIAAPGGALDGVKWPKPNLIRVSDQAKLELLGAIPLPDGEAVADAGPSLAVVAHGADEAWIAIVTARQGPAWSSRLLVIDWKNGAFGPVQVVMDSEDFPQTAPTVNPMNFRDLIAFEVEGSRWVGVVDQSVPNPKVPTRGPRLFRVDSPTCRYKPLAP